MKTELRTPRPEKVAVVDDVRSRLNSAAATIITEYRGLSVAQIQILRRALVAAGGEYKIYKNTLVRRAAHENGLESLDDLLDGPTALAFVTGDVSSVAKALKEFARTNPKLVVKGALVGGGLFDAAQTSALADLPSRDVLLAQIAAAFAAPLQAFAGLLGALPRKFAYGLAALIEQRGGVEQAAPPAPEEEDVAEPEVSEPEAGADASGSAGEPVVADEAAPEEGSAGEPAGPERSDTAGE
ncbi:MAG: 50S ribosomal protein L10 [Acidimicrobiales bacterium]